MDDLRQKTLSGVRWMGLSQVVGQAARFVVAALLARMVPPAEFGLFQMAFVFNGFAALLSDVGLGAALIQRREIDERQLSATFWLNTLVSVALAVLLCSLSGVVARFYDRPVVAVLLCAITLDIVLASLAIVHRALLIRAMNYKRISLAEISGIGVGGAAALASAYGGAGAWSLVVLTVSTSAATSLLLWFSLPWRPGRFRVGISRELLGFGLHLQGFNIVNYWLRNLDKFLIGKFFGEAALGLYSRAYTTMLLPQVQISGMLERVMWPALARCGDDLERLRGAYLRALRLVAFVAFPLMAGLLVTAEDFIRTIYGPRWVECVPALQWLCVAGLAQAPASTAGWLYLATGRTRRLLAWGLLAGSVIAGGIVAGIVWGSIVRVAMIYAATSVFLLPLAFAMAGSCARLGLRAIFGVQAGSFAATVVMAALVAALARLLPGGLPPVVRLGVCVGTGAAVYAGLALLFRLAAVRELMAVLRDATHKTPPASDRREG